jgi:hypothetical protein
MAKPIGKKPMVPQHLTIVVMIVDEKKFAIVAGIPYVNKPNDQHLITPKSTLETPIFSLGLTTMQLEFDQAYYLEAGAWLK